MIDSVFSQLSGRLDRVPKLLPNPAKDKKVVLGVILDDYQYSGFKIVHPLISSIIPNSPAERAGGSSPKNDIIFKLDNEESMSSRID